MQRVEANAIGKLGRVLDVPDRQVGALARRRWCRNHSSPSAVAALRVTPASASSGVRRNRVQAMFMASSSEVKRRGAGVAVGRHGHRHTVLAEGLDRRQLRLAQRVEGAGQQHRDRAGRGHGRDVRLVAVFQVIGRQGAVAARPAARRRDWTAARHAASPAGPSSRAIAKTRSIWSGEKAMPSQKPSTASTSPSAWAALSVGHADLVDIGVRPPVHSGGMAWAPRKARPDRAPGDVARCARAARSIFSSVSRSSP